MSNLSHSKVGIGLNLVHQSQSAASQATNIAKELSVTPDVMRTECILCSHASVYANLLPS
jgi:hypothetical protein